MSMTNSNNIQLESQEHFNPNEQTDPSLLSLTEWVQLKKETSYKLYLDLHQRLQKKEKFIENVLVTIEACKNKFQPGVFVVVEVIPFKETD